MREIKFRVWDKRTSHMSLVANMKFGDDGLAQTIMAEPAPKGHYYNAIVHGEHATLMQFTGIKDVKGKDIYEGDIVSATLKTYKGDREVTNKVYFNDEKASFGPFNHRHNYDEDLWIDIVVNIEIIGNIYENPELIEVH